MWLYRGNKREQLGTFLFQPTTPENRNIYGYSKNMYGDNIET